jgi:hypothetical protein
MYKPFLKAKIDECWNCGRRLSIKQRYCPCGKPNLDYKPKYQIGSAIKAVQEDEKETPTGPPVDKDSVEYV